jgi:hypothetical protein
MLSEASYHNMTVGRIPSVEGGIQPTIVDAKGDLIAAVAADSLNRLAVGTNDQVLVADSAASTGLAWKSYGAQVVAGKNAIINGGMDIWQRGTSSSTATGGAYSTADRYLINLGGTTTASQDTDVPSGVSVQYSLKFLTGASSSYGGWYYALESAMVKPLRGQTVTVSFYVKTAGSFSGNLNLNIDYSNSTDALASQTTNVTTLVFAGSQQGYDH